MEAMTWGARARRAPVIPPQAQAVSLAKESPRRSAPASASEPMTTTPDISQHAVTRRQILLPGWLALPSPLHSDVPCTLSEKRHSFLPSRLNSGR